MTLTDLSRLMSLQYVHGGALRCIPHGVGESFDALEKAGLVAIERDETVDCYALAFHATITERGIRVVEAGMNAMMKELENG